jgi:hypothetical protein
MLDLDARVHLHKVEFAIGGEEKLHRAGPYVADALRSPHGRLPHPLPKLRVHHRRRGLLEQLLVTPLRRAIPLAQMNDPSVGGTEHLDLHVSRSFEKLFEVHAAIAEAGLRFAAGLGEDQIQFGRFAGDPHPLSAPAGSCLHQDGKADLLGDPPDHPQIVGRPRRSPI